MGLLQVRFLSVLLVSVVVAHVRPELERLPEAPGAAAGVSSLQRVDSTASVRVPSPEPHLDGGLPTHPPAGASTLSGYLVTDAPAATSLSLSGRPHGLVATPAVTEVSLHEDGRSTTATSALAVPGPSRDHLASGLLPAYPVVPNALDAPTSPRWSAAPPITHAPFSEWGSVVAEPTGHGGGVTSIRLSGVLPTLEPGAQRQVQHTGQGHPVHGHPAHGHIVHGQPVQGHRHHPPCRPGMQRVSRCEASVRADGVSTRVVCSGGLHKMSRNRSHNKTMALVLCYWPDDTLDPSMLTMFERLERFRVTDSNVTELLDFPRHEHLQEVVLAGLRLTWLGDDVFVGLRRLRLLDLSRNQLSSLRSAVVLRQPGLQHLLLAGNPWRCTLPLSWLTEPSARRLIADPAGMQCGAALFPRRPVLPVLALLKRVFDECPASHPCSCELTGVVRDAREAPLGARRNGAPGVVTTGDLVPIITVNCSHRSLGVMPGRLPTNTTTLLLRGNKITSVRPLVDRHAGVLDVYLDGNQVESIADLEGSPWLANFRVLSLRANKLQQLPTYALDNALERNDHVVRVYLGLNPWRCDCQFTPPFQELLAKYKPLIQDWDDIRCASVDGDDNSMKKIHALSRGAVCREEGEPRVSALDLVNAALAVSLLAVLSKLAFDFWRYRRYGRLPWIATKLP